MAMSGLTKLAKLIAAFAAVISIMFAATTPSQAQTGTVRINVFKDSSSAPAAAAVP